MLSFLPWCGGMAADRAFQNPHHWRIKMTENKLSTFGKAYGYDKELAKGKWFNIRGIKTKLAFQNEPNVIASVKTRREELNKQLKRELNDEEHEQIGIECFVELVLLDWETEDNYPCTKETKKAIIEEHPDYISECIQISQDNRAFQEKVIEDTVGN